MHFINLHKQYTLIEKQINEGIQKVLSHGKFIMGPEVYEFEEKLADYVGVKHVISCANGTDALLMPLMAWGIGKGDAVFTTVFSFFATAEVIALIGATPVFVDIEETTFNICTNSLEKQIVKIQKEAKLSAKGIIPVDLFGLSADYDKILEIATKHNLKVLADAAQSFGGAYYGKKNGSYGDAAGTSFFPLKPLGCYGDGGAMFTNDDELAERLRSIRVHGHGADKYDNIRLGLNSRLDTLQAAILLPKLAILDKEIVKRDELAKEYNSALGETVKVPCIPSHSTSAWAQYSVLAKNLHEREDIQISLNKVGIPSMIYYKKPLHLQEALAGLGYKAGDFPVAEDVANRILSLPMHPYLEVTQQKAMVEAVVNSGR